MSKPTTKPPHGPHKPPVPAPTPSHVYVDPSGNDGTAARNDPGHPCATIGHAVTMALAGDTISVLPGTYSLLVPIKIPNDVSLIGNEMPTLNCFVPLVSPQVGGVAGVAIVPGDRSLIKGFTIAAALSPAQFQALIGSKNQGGFVNAHVEGCVLNGISDGFYFMEPNALKSLSVQNCQVKTQYDGVQTLDNEIEMVVSGCSFEMIGPSPLQSSEPAHGIICRGKMTIQNCRIKVAGPNPGNRGLLNSKFGTGATISICGTTFDVTGPSDFKDYEVDPGSTLIGPLSTCA